MNDLSKAFECGEDLPPLLGINTGQRKYKPLDKGLFSVLESHLKEHSAPFHEHPNKVGWLLAATAEAKSWLESKGAMLIFSVSFQFYRMSPKGRAFFSPAAIYCVRIMRRYPMWDLTESSEKEKLNLKNGGGLTSPSQFA
ncbi:hypothetical protein PIB30_097707 [Stylosanthes scabra]|uniref:Uncharacterized protein n=1 Tax=Stylosanthes scabra TaxID=79078 RepID=A0ABU6YVB3_9FABA|nr:hypothetical protein [Stylosanthes scabra]